MNEALKMFDTCFAPDSSYVNQRWYKVIRAALASKDLPERPAVGEGRIWDGEKWLEICPSLEALVTISLMRKVERLESQLAIRKAPDKSAPKRYWMIEQPDLDEDDDYKRIHTTDLDVWPDAKVLGEYELIEPKKFATMPQSNRKFGLGDLVYKKSGGFWRGKVVGFYSTDLTPIGYCVESSFETGSVQIYPESALEKSQPWIFTSKSFGGDK